MAKFNVGDKVRATGTDAWGMVEGGVYTVLETDDDETVKLGETGYWHRESRLELFSDEPVAVVVDTKQEAEYEISARNGKVVISLSGNFSTKKVADILEVAFN
jgi:hypothetical protein